MSHEINTVLFDLDGTLADSAPDLTESLNQLFIEQDQQTVSLADVRSVVSLGSSAMLRLRLEFAENSPQHQQWKQRLFEIYNQRAHVLTTPFEGMAECLDKLESQGIQWGIVTNKLSHLAAPLVAKLGLEHRSACLVCADTTGHAKPHPAPLLHAARQLDTAAQCCVYVGDARHDITAARRANMAALVAAYGYIPTNEDPTHWQADAIIDTPSELLSWLHPAATAQRCGSD